MRPGESAARTERVILTGSTPQLLVLESDVPMLVLARGKERSDVEFRTLLHAAGFEFTRLIPVLAPFYVIEAGGSTHVRSSVVGVVRLHPLLRSLPTRVVTTPSAASSSLRGRAQLLQLRPDLRIISIRGNVDTRPRSYDKDSLGAVKQTVTREYLQIIRRPSVPPKPHPP
jgi:Porphobilinogen deaminase, dipyromethane cofactor binding domain